jgi:hypothetical protein
MIHLHRLGNGEIIAVLGTFPCLFLPALSPQTESERKTFAQGNAVLRKKQQRHKDNSTVTQFSVKLNETISLEKYQDIEPRVGLPDWQILFDFMNCSHLQQANENTIFAGKAP